METKSYTLTYLERTNDIVTFSLKDKKAIFNILFTFYNETIQSELKNEALIYQLKKIIQSALKGNLIPGQQIHFSFIKDFPFLSENDYNNYIRVDRRFNKVQIKTSKNETINIHKLYTDGSFASEAGKSAFAGIIIGDKGIRTTFQSVSEIKSSNQIELVAVIEGLKLLPNKGLVQVNTDSRFVIRGLSQWVHFWKLNNWHTALGEKVKFVDYWQEIDYLTSNKFLELKWIKAHNGDIEHTWCHRRAKELAIKTN